MEIALLCFPCIVTFLCVWRVYHVLQYEKMKIKIGNLAVNFAEEAFLAGKLDLYDQHMYVAKLSVGIVGRHAKDPLPLERSTMDKYGIFLKRVINWD